MSYKVEFIKEAAKDYRNLDGSVKKLVNIKIEELSKNPMLGDKLGNKNNIDLTGFFKIYVFKKKYRIVYRLITPEGNRKQQKSGGIGKRDKEEIYRIIGKRLKDR